MTILTVQALHNGLGWGGDDLDLQTTVHEGWSFRVIVSRQRTFYRLEGIRAHEDFDTEYKTWFYGEFKCVPHPCYPVDVRRGWLLKRLLLWADDKEIKEGDVVHTFLAEACTAAVLTDSFFRYR